MGNNDTNAILDDILARLHNYMRNHKGGGGFPRSAAGMNFYRTSRQYDDQNGALDDDVDRSIMASVAFQVGEMAEPYRSAMYEEARNLCMGIAVFRSPRLPTDPRERQVVIKAARLLLVARLVNAGVM